MLGSLLGTGEAVQRQCIPGSRWSGFSRILQRYWSHLLICEFWGTALSGEGTVADWRITWS
eukprot:7957957-Pyramimonas_sp.AAC.1